MKLTFREKFWLRALIVYWAILPILMLFSSPQWIVRTNVWVLLLLAIGNGLLWLVLAVALVAVNRALIIGPAVMPQAKAAAGLAHRRQI